MSNNGEKPQLMITNNKNKAAKVGPLMSRAMDDIRMKVSELMRKKYGRCPNVTDKDALEIIGWKYLEKNFGRASAEDIAMILGMTR